jgi:hypothetical protein
VGGRWEVVSPCPFLVDDGGFPFRAGPAHSSRERVPANWLNTINSQPEYHEYSVLRVSDEGVRQESC